MYWQVGDRKDITVVVMGKKEIPSGTLKNIPALANVSIEEFLRHLR